MEGLELISNFWHGKHVFLTGHTGFKGSWLSLLLQNLGAEVTGFSLEPSTKNNLFKIANVEKSMISIISDIRDLSNLQLAMKAAQPDIVIHMAAQPLVQLSYKEPVETYATNVMGTVHVLESIRHIPSIRAAVMVTTDKCYENKEWLWGYRENDIMGGHDPYSNSKACVELITSAYRHSYFNHQLPSYPSIATARAGNVIGGGDWAANRLIPDILEAFEKKVPANIRNPSAIRPWQHVLEPLCGYLNLAKKLYLNGSDYAESWNFGPQDNDVHPVEWIADYLTNTWGGGASWKEDLTNHPHESHCIKLDISKAKSRLGWEPQWPLEITLQKILIWHKAWLNNEDMHKLCLSQIQEYFLTIDSSLI